MNANAFQRTMEQDRDHVLEDGQRLLAALTEKLRLGATDGLFTREEEAMLRGRIEGYKGMLAGMQAVYRKYLTIIQEIGAADARQEAARAQATRALYVTLGPCVAYEEFARLLVDYLYPQSARGEWLTTNGAQPSA